MTNLLLFFFVLCYVLDSTVLARTHYEVLGVRKDVSAPELKKTYRKLAKEWHPDRHQNAEKKKIAEKKFMEISEAYETLADEEKRRDYDDELRGGSRSFPRGARSGAGFGGFGKGNTMEDMFSSFFGGGSQRRQKSSGFSFSSRSKRPRPTSWDFGSLSRFSNLEVLGKDDILNTLGKSFRGNSNYVAVFLDTTTMSKDTQMQILTKLDSFQSKSAPLTKTVLIDCINKPHSVCKKYSSKDSMNTKFFSDMSEDAHSITSPSDVKKIYKDFIDKIPPATLIDLKNHEEMITTVRSCLKNTKNTLGCAFLVVDDDMKSWKLKAAAEMLKSRADLFIVRRDKMGTNLLRSLIGLSDKDSNLYVYKNTVLNKADVRLDNLKGFKLDLSNLDKMPLTDLKPQLTRDIWK